MDHPVALFGWFYFSIWFPESPETHKVSSVFSWISHSGFKRETFSYLQFCKGNNFIPLIRCWCKGNNFLSTVDALIALRSSLGDHANNILQAGMPLMLLHVHGFMLLAILKTVLFVCKFLSVSLCWFYNWMIQVFYWVLSDLGSANLSGELVPQLAQLPNLQYLYASSYFLIANYVSCLLHIA